MSFWIALRYFFSKSNTSLVNIISFITLISVVFITISMFVVLSIFNGFESIHYDTYDKIIPDLKIENVKKTTFSKNTSFLQTLEKYKSDGIINFCKVLEQEVIIQYKDSNTKNNKKAYTILKGVDSNYKNVYDSFKSSGDSLPKAIILASDFYSNHFLNDTNFIIVGEELASQLSFKVAHSFNLYKQDLKIWHLKINNKRPELNYSEGFINYAIFLLGERNIDNIAIAHIDRVQTIFESDEYSYIEIKVKNGDINTIQNNIQNDLGDDFIVKNKSQQLPLIFKLIKTEKLIVYLIFILIIIITMITLMGSIIILINQKKEDIVIFNALGYSINKIKSIFTYLGFLIVFFGFVLGMILGSIICLVQQTSGIVKFASDFGAIAYPVQFRGSDIFIIAFIILGMGILISMIVSKLVFMKKMT